MVYPQEYKERDISINNNNYFGANKSNISSKNNIDLLSQRDLSLNSINSSLPNYTSYHLNYCLDNCSDRDLINFVKWKVEHDIKTFKLWMRIIASNITPQIDQENVIINEWYHHLNINTNNNIINNNDNNENKENELSNDSGSEEEEHYSISTAELDCSPNNKYKLLSTTAIKKASDLDLNLNQNEKKEIQHTKTKTNVDLILIDKKKKIEISIIDPLSTIHETINHLSNFIVIITVIFQLF